MIFDSLGVVGNKRPTAEPSGTGALKIISHQKCTSQIKVLIMCDYYDLKYIKINDPEWVFKCCINRLSENAAFSSNLKSLVSGGGIGGDVDWGIHRWDENTELDYGVTKFEGYRFYVGADDHHTSDSDIEGFKTEAELNSILIDVSCWYKSKHSEKVLEINKVLEELGLVHRVIISDQDQKGQSH